VELSKVYLGGVPVAALVEANVEIFRGETVALQGPSGSGKSTLLGLLGLLDIPTKGFVRVSGENATGLGDAARSRLRAVRFGFIFQQFNLIPYLTAKENVAVSLLYRNLSPKTRGTMAEEILEQVGLRDRLNHKPGQLSGGEQQRVAVARAVVAGPEVILADEPTGNLDSDATAAILDLLVGFVERGVALVVATHDPEVAARSDRSLRMRDGQLEAIR
jgi:putative ABC transport system ATP-binding protein